jgi:D-methionine transport system substrate-binding protein
MQRRSFLKYALAGAGAVSVSALTGCGLVNPGGTSAASGGKTIKIIVTESAPYQEPTKIAQKLLEAKGWTLEPTYVTDIIQPNLAVANGEFDANFFQHNAYLRQFNQDKNLENVGLFYVYSAPGGIWSDKYKSLDELPDGARIGIPVDPANNGRALFMLRDAGLLELSEATVIHTSQKNITANPKKLQFVEVDQQSLAKTLPDVDAGFLVARMAADAKHTKDDALAFESDADQIPFRIVVAGRKDFAGSEKADALKEAFQSPEVKAWFASYQNGILPTPWDQDPSADITKL